MERVLMVEGDKCTGCQMCELACSMVKFKEFSPKKAYIRILKNSELGVYIPALSPKCDACGKCIEWCFDGAIRFVTLEEAALQRKGARIGSFPAPFAE